MFLLFFLLWLLLSGGISVHTCLWGVAVSALISWFCKRVLGYQWRVFCGSPFRIWAMARYFAHLLAEMLKAGLVIMRIIYTRPKGIVPKLVGFHTPLTIPFAGGTDADYVMRLAVGEEVVDDALSDEADLGGGLDDLL